MEMKGERERGQRCCRNGGGGEIEYWGGGWGWVWGRRNAKGEEGMKKGRGYWQDGDEDTRTRGERASGKKKNSGVRTGLFDRHR